MVRVFTVAAPNLVITPVFCSAYTGVMTLDNIAQIGRTTVADFDRALVEYLT